MNKFEAFKMDCLGNDFIIFDKRKNDFSLSKDQIIQISKRSNIGCDQVIFINKDIKSDAFLTFFNSDGGEIYACGNGSRCIAYFLINESKKKNMSLRTKAGILKAELNNNNLIRLNLGEPNFYWKKIPLTKEMNNENLKIKISNIGGKKIEGGFALSVGNPHVIFFVNNCEEYNLKKIGPKIENHAYFPEKCNVTLAEIKNKKHVKIKVWERGAGLTKACGTAASATIVSTHLMKLTERCADVEFKEGTINIDWNSDNNIYMTGKVSKIKKISINV